MVKKLNFFVSTENKILLHLKRFVKIEATKKVPQDIIQVGIATKLGSPRGSVSRALGNLVSKGFVEEKLCRVEASKRRMNAYFLTWEGRSQVDALEHKLATELIDARSGDGTLTEVTLAEALDLNEDPITTGEIIRAVEQNGFYDPDVHKAGSVTDAGGRPGAGKSAAAGSAAGAAEAQPAPAGIGRIPPPSRSEKELLELTRVPPVHTFFGRTEELKQLTEQIENHPVLIIKGMAGIGKTTLSSKLLRGLDPSWKVFWFRLQEWDTAKGVLQALAESFAATGHSKLLDELRSMGSDLDMFRITRILGSEFSSFKAILAFDDAHRAGESVKQLFSALIEQIEPGALIHLLLISRSHLPVYDQRDVAVKKLVHEVELKGLDRESAKLLLGNDQIPEAAFTRLYNMTRGHPLALELIKFTGHVTDISDMMKFINEQVFQKLKKDEKALLSSISVHRVSAPIRAFLIEEEADFDTVDELINRTLLVEEEPTRYDIHDLIREFFSSRLIAKNRKRYHLHAAEFYSSSTGEDPSVLEAVYHYINAGEQDKAAEIMVNRAPALISLGHLDEAMNILTKFDSNVKTEYLAKLYTIKGDILSTWGEWDNVFEYYWQCYFISILEKISQPKWQLLGSYGFIGWKPSEIEVAVKNLNSSLDVLKESGDEDGILEIESSLAWLNWMTGSYRDAESMYKKIQKKEVSAGREQSAAKIMIKLGNVYWADSKLDKALELYQKGLDVFSSISDDNGAARTNSNMALVYMEKGDHRKTDEYLQQCIQISERRQYKRGLGYGLLHKAQQLMLKGELEDAGSVLERARSTFETLGDSLGLGYTTAMRGLMLKLKDDFAPAIKDLESTLNNLRGFLMPYYKSLIYNELCNLYKATGDSEKARECQLHAVEKSEQKDE